MKKSERTKTLDFTRPAVRKDFWEFLISRHPVEEDYSKSTKLAYRWRTIHKHRLVVVQFVSIFGVGVFLRGERSVNPIDVEQRLKPHEKRLRRILAPDSSTSVDGARYFFQSRMNVDTSKKSNWVKMADWLHNKADTYEGAIRQVMASLP
jgi:hypothetical protein